MRFSIKRDTEITIEVDPEVIKRNYLHEWADFEEADYDWESESDRKEFVKEMLYDDGWDGTEGVEVIRESEEGWEFW